jgi:predicted O-methyltransferase YrrM
MARCCTNSSAKKENGRSLEIGLAFGVASLYMCQGHIDNGGGHHTAIDPHQETWFKQCGTLNIERLGFGESFRFFEQRSYEVLPDLHRNEERFDVIFLDGNHRFEYVMIDLFYGYRLLNVGGFIVLHDLWMPSTRKAVSFVVRNLLDEFDIYAPALQRKPTILGALYTCARLALRRPYDLGAARLYAAAGFGNYAVFEKMQEHEPDHYDIDWDYYRPF